MHWSGAKTSDSSSTRAAGAEFAGSLPAGTVVALHGPLGSGKTTFVQGIARGLGLMEEVTSPTFGLIHEYGDPAILYHIDCYRERSLERWVQLGVSEYLDGRVTAVIEWAEIIAPLLPGNTIDLYFAHGATEVQRIISVDHEPAGS